MLRGHENDKKSQGVLEMAMHVCSKFKISRPNLSIPVEHKLQNLGMYHEVLNFLSTKVVNAWWICAYVYV